jgi:hypothetical protein
MKRRKTKKEAITLLFSELLRCGCKQRKNNTGKKKRSERNKRDGVKSAVPRAHPEVLSNI